MARTKASVRVQKTIRRVELLAIRRKDKFIHIMENVLSCMDKLTEDEKNIWREIVLKSNRSDFKYPLSLMVVFSKLISENSVTEDEIKWSKWVKSKYPPKTHYES